MFEALYEQRPLGDAVERHIGGGTPPRQVPSYWKGEIPWASVKDFPEQKGVIQDTEEYISSAGLHASASNLIPAQTPLVCTRMAVGRAALPVIPMAINQDVKALFPAPGISAEYLLKLIQYIQPLAEGRAVGSTVKGIRIQDYLNIPVPLAPQAAQPVIAQILDTLDTAIRETEALIDKLKAVKQGLLHDLLTRGIDANGQLRPPQSEAPQLYKESPLGWIPREWSTCGVLDIAPVDRQCILTGPFGAQLGQADFVAEGVPVLRIGNVQSGYIDWSDVQYVSPVKASKLERFRVMPGDLLFARQGATTGRNALADERSDGTLINYHIIRVAVDREKCEPTYLYALFNSDHAKGQVDQEKGRGTREGINSRQIASLEFALPPIAEQKGLVARMSTLNEAVDNESALLAKLRLQKSGLMDDLLTGRVRVTPLLESVQAPLAQTGA